MPIADLAQAQGFGQDLRKKVGELNALADQARQLGIAVEFEIQNSNGKIAVKTSLKVAV